MEKETKVEEGVLPFDDKSSVQMGVLSRASSRIEAMGRNMAIIDNALEEIGMGKYQWKLFLTCGFGFLMDQMLLVSAGLCISPILKEFVVEYPDFVVLALYLGALIGALLCGPAIDSFGRRTVWTYSLFALAAACMICAGSPNFAGWCVFVVFAGIAGGGNLAIDLTVFSEFLPRTARYLMTSLALFWGIGSVIGGLLAWPLIGNFSCPADATPATCTRSDNMGWRYQYILLGGLCLVMALIRTFIFPLEESPKWLVTQGHYERASATIAEVARINDSDFVFNQDELIHVSSEHSETIQSESRDMVSWHHVKGLFETKRLARSTVSVTIIWMCIGVAYPVYTLFLSTYLANHGANLGDGSLYQTYRDYSISNVVGVFGPIFAALLCRMPLLGRRRSLTLTAFVAAVFAGAFTTVRDEASNIAFSSMINFWQNAFYGILWAYTPEVMPTQHRGTGCGLTLVFGRLASLTSPFVATFGNTSTSIPLFVCCGLYVVIGLIAFTLPFEPNNFQAGSISTIEEAELERS